MPSRQQGRYSVVFAAIVAIATLLFLFSLLQHHFDGPVEEVSGSQHAIAKGVNERQPFEMYKQTSEVKPLVDTEIEKRIYAGLHIENIYDLSLKERVFMAEGWYWLKWSDTVNAILKQNQIPQEKIIDFTNQVEASSMVVQADQPSPERLDNGYLWQLFRFSGKFYIEDLELRGFPFDVLRAC